MLDLVVDLTFNGLMYRHETSISYIARQNNTDPELPELVATIRAGIFDRARVLSLLLFRHLRERDVGDVEYPVVLPGREDVSIQSPGYVSCEGTYLGLSEAMIHDVQEAVRAHGVVHLRGELCAAFGRAGFGDVYDGQVRPFHCEGDHGESDS